MAARAASRAALSAAPRAYRTQAPAALLTHAKGFPGATAPARFFSSPVASTDSVKVEMVEGTGIALVTLDLAGSKVNTLGAAFAEELPPVLDGLESSPEVKAIVFISGKKGDFIAGADIDMIGQMAKGGKEGVKSGVGSLQEIMHKISTGKPKIAAINGHCLGGGAEFALACHYRIATDSPGTQIGFPEVMLGLLPGAGGTQRLPELVGVQNAMPMIMTGASKKAKAAKSMKLVDHICPPGGLKECAIEITKGLISGTTKMPKRGEFDGVYKYVEMGIKEYGFVRDYVFSEAKKQVMKMTGGNYPAPLRIIDVLKKSVASKSLGKPKGFAEEADGFADLALTPESAGLRNVFFGQTALKKNPLEGAKKVERVGVLGAGLMGAGIAEISIGKGLTTVLKDITPEALSVGERNIAASFAKKVKKKKMAAFDRDMVVSKLIGVSNKDKSWPVHMNKCDVVIEAVFEDLGLKHKIVAEMESVCNPNCIIATNTSSLPVGEIAKNAQRPENIVGMHYFSPVPQMQLVEIIPHAGTDPVVTATAVQLALKQGKMPVICKDVPGFYVNRCLGPYIDESMTLAFEVDNYMQLDKAMKSFGMPVGPMVLADEVGIEVAMHLHENLRPDLGVRVGSANVAAIEAIKAAGLKGKRFGSGFLSYPSGKKPSGIAGMFAAKETTKQNPAAVEAMRPFFKPAKYDDSEISLRISARFVNEAIFCLQDGVIRNATDGDMAAIFGVGFPPFTGGPFRYVDSVGTAKYCDELKRLADKYGPHFAPAPLLEDMAKSNKKFHS